MALVTLFWAQWQSMKSPKTDACPVDASKASRSSRPQRQGQDSVLPASWLWLAGASRRGPVGLGGVPVGGSTWRTVLKQGCPAHRQWRQAQAPAVRPQKLHLATAEQLHCHKASSMPGAFSFACCLQASLLRHARAPARARLLQPRPVSSRAASPPLRGAAGPCWALAEPVSPGRGWSRTQPAHGSQGRVIWSPGPSSAFLRVRLPQARRREGPCLVR